MRLNLDDLSLRGGQRHECVYNVEVAPVTLGGVEYRVLVAEGAGLVVERVAGGYMIGVKIDAKAYGPCARCLKEAELDLHAEQDEFTPTAAGGWPDSETSSFINDMVVDVSGLCREALVLAIPDRPLCSPECKGLCAQCGEDLNLGACECGALELSKPMR